MTTDKEMQKFWDTCPEEFAHIKIEGQNKVAQVDWDKEFLHKLNDITNLPFKRIVDYGSGGGQLGIHLHKKYGIGSYNGLDISARQIKNAHDRLWQYNKDLKQYKNDKSEMYTRGMYIRLLDFEMIPAHSIDFFRPGGIADVFISQATIQHFPSLDYLTAFLNKLNNSNIDTVVLQFRTNNSNITAIMNDGYEKVHDVCFKCYTNTSFIEKELTNYELKWEGPFIKAVQGQYIILRLKRTY